jgi:hypothetical protein
MENSQSNVSLIKKLEKLTFIFEEEIASTLFPSDEFFLREISLVTEGSSLQRFLPQQRIMSGRLFLAKKSF